MSNDKNVGAGLPHSYKLSDYDYSFPKELIALRPLKRRDSSRLLVVDRSDGEIMHKSFTDLTFYLKKNDALILNNTKVLPVSLTGVLDNGKAVNILILEKIDAVTAKCLVKPAKKFKKGAKIFFENKKIATVLEEYPSKVLDFSCHIDDLLKDQGSMPLPPYIKRDADKSDFSTYQTVYAKEEGAVAAPTAGLHFTKDILTGISKVGVNIDYVTLHVGYGTFKPVREEDIRQHKMHSEKFNVSEKTIDLIERTRKNSGKILAAGTTSCRVLETIAKNNVGTGPCACPYGIKGDRRGSPLQGETNLFIYPPYKFKLTDMLLTNFHLPKTTLLMLVAAFCGYDLMMKAYKEAVENRYRLFSYGDAMLII